MHERRRRRAGLAAVRLVAGLLFFELVLRLVAPFSSGVRSWTTVPQDAHDFAAADDLRELLEMSALGYDPCRDVGGFVTNNRGLRTPDYAADKPPGTLRVVALGDSFTFASGGVPWPDLWTTRLQRLLEDGRVSPVEVINLGAPMVGPSFERRMWQVEGAHLGADVVLLALYVGNDFRDEAWAPDDSFFSSVGRHSDVLRVVRNLLSGRVAGTSQHVPGTPDAEEQDDEPPQALGGHEQPDYRRIFLARRPLYTPAQLRDIAVRDMRVCDRSQAASFADLAARLERAVANLAQDVGASGARLLVVVVPDRVQVQAADRAAMLAATRRPDSDFDWDAPQRWLTEMLERHGIASLDLLPAMRVESARRDEAVARGEAPEPLYATDDTHWSPAGNALAAALVVQQLERETLVPAGSSGNGH